MRKIDSTWILSPSDLSEFLACEHLTNSRVAAVNRERNELPKNEGGHTKIVKRRGEEHEIEQIRLLEEQLGTTAFDLKPREGQWPSSIEEMRLAASKTLTAMKEGHRLITQAVIFDEEEPWFGSGDADDDSGDVTDGDAHRFGLVDVLRRVENCKSDLGNFAYEVVEIKLARQIKPKFVHQVEIYSRALAKMQGFSPGKAWLRLGDEVEHPVHLPRYRAVGLRQEGRLRRFVEDPPRIASVAEPVSHCSVCPLEGECNDQRVAADHLSLVANLSGVARGRLEESGLSTLAELASPNAVKPDEMTEEVFSRLANQARLQLESRESGEPIWKNLDPSPGNGYCLLPPADPADVFFDLEGDPYEGPEGIEYLWGWHKAGAPYECRWAHNEPEEKLALEEFVDQIYGEWQSNPGMHVYHYAPHEASKLSSLCVKYGTREKEVDDLLRGKVLVDLYAVVRQSMQVGEDSYSLKKLERHHGFERAEETVLGGGGSIVAYETFLATNDDKSPEAVGFLEAIRAYNEDDCRSTESLRDWLLNVTKPEAAAKWPEADLDYWDKSKVSEEKEELTDLRKLEAALLDGLSLDPDNDTPDEAERRLMAGLVMYNRREQNVTFQRIFTLKEMTSEDLVGESDAIGGIEPDVSVPLFPKSTDSRNQSLIYTYRFPPQDVRIPFSPSPFLVGERPLADNEADSPEEQKKPANVDYVRHSVDPVSGWGTLELSRVGLDGTEADRPNPIGVIPGVVPTETIVRQIVKVANALLSGNTSSYSVAQSLLKRTSLKETNSGLSLTVEALSDDALALTDGVLPVQGPPGAGKTYQASHMILDALEAGRVVGVSALGHSAIRNLLIDVENEAAVRKFTLRGGYRLRSGEQKDSWLEASPHNLIAPITSNERMIAQLMDKKIHLIAGTAWAFSAEADKGTVSMEDLVDILFIDEAGQYQLANTIAASTASSQSMVLLGDPQQLSQPTQASHPANAQRSSLAHSIGYREIFGDRKTICAEDGVLLDQSFRMHPEICEFISWLSYDGKLSSTDDCSQRKVAASGELTGTGLRYIPVQHSGSSQYSRAEALVIAKCCLELLEKDSTVTTLKGANRDVVTRSLVAADILVVAPYNLAVQEIAKVVPEGVRVGTVDKFQGQEAPVVFYAMTCSSAEDAPRGMSFLFDDHRLNVAISRAQCLAVLVANPRLLDAPARTIEQLELVNGVCELVSRAQEVEVIV